VKRQEPAAFIDLIELYESGIEAVKWLPPDWQQQQDNFRKLQDEQIRREFELFVRWLRLTRRLARREPVGR